MRYLPHSPHEMQAMLQVIGVASEEDLFSSIPQDHRGVNATPTKGLPEFRLLARLEAIAAKNTILETKLAGAGVYFHAIPAAVSHIVSRSEFMTAYTPYQPEVSQGTLQAVFEFQTMVAELMGMEVSNASLYDGATGLGEALLMAIRYHKNKKSRILISSAIHPLWLKVVKTMLSSFGNIEAEYLDYDPETGTTLLPEKLGDDVAAIALGYPNFFGVIEPLDRAAALAAEADALAISVTQDAALLATLTPPGELGCNIAVAEGMSIAGTMGMGGPSVGLMATTGKKLVKQMPGRIVGETLDAKGERGYVLTLATREQHIKRERATSNICTNQALVALAFSVHVSLLGHLGLERINNISHNRALRLLEGLTKIPGVTRHFTGPFLNEFAVTFPGDVDALWRFMADRGVLFGVPMTQLCGEDHPLKQTIIFATTETVEPHQIDRAVALAAEFYGKGAPHA